MASRRNQIAGGQNLAMDHNSGAVSIRILRIQNPSHRSRSPDSISGLLQVQDLLEIVSTKDQIFPLMECRYF